MVDFRPYILKAQVNLTEDTYNPRTGSIEKGFAEDVEFECRITPNGAGKEVASSDGRHVVYSYLIHANNNAYELPFGTDVKVYQGDKLIAEGKVLNFWSNQLNVRVWL